MPLPAEGQAWSLAALDEAGRDGWQAVGIAPVGGPSLHVLVMRPCADDGPVPAPVARPIPPPPHRGPLVGRRDPPPPNRPL